MSKGCSKDRNFNENINANFLLIYFHHMITNTTTALTENATDRLLREDEAGLRKDVTYNKILHLHLLLSTDLNSE